MKLEDLFVKQDTKPQYTISRARANKLQAKTVDNLKIINAKEFPEHILSQLRHLTPGVPQRLVRTNKYYMSHSIFSR